MPKAQSLPLSLVLALLTAACAAPAPPPVSSPPASSEANARARLEVSRVDDDIDPFATVARTSLPDGIRIERESSRAGAPPTSFAHALAKPGESAAATRARLRAFLESVPLPPGRRFGVETVTGDGASNGARSVVLASDPILRTEDVLHVTLFEATRGDEAPPSLRVRLTPDAGARFERATHEWVGRRMAIVVDDEVLAAPLVRDPIVGGEIALTFGPDHNRADVVHVAQTLAR